MVDSVLEIFLDLAGNTNHTCWVGKEKIWESD